MGININGAIWCIQFVDRYNPIFIMDNGQYTIGVTDRNTQTIYVANDLDSELLEKVIKHEICHAIMFTEGIDMSIPTEECVCDILATYGDDVDRITNEIHRHI